MAQRPTMELVAELVALYEAGLSLRDLGTRVGLDHMAVRAVLLRQGVRLRPVALYPRVAVRTVGDTGRGGS